MLKGRLGLDAARIPQKSRNGLFYVERARLTIDNGSLTIVHEEAGHTHEIPYQRLNAVLLGPGSSITPDALRHLAAHGTAVAAVGTDGTRIYTAPPVFERDSTLARQQARYWGTDQGRLLVAKRMYAKRFGETPRATSAEALRGMEAARIKRSYELIAQQAGIQWSGRRFDRSKPNATDVPNQAINHVVTALEACVATAVQATATLPPLGFLHEDSAKSWILDICDLYRTTVTVPIAFGLAKRIERGSAESIDRLARRAVSDHVRKHAFIDQVIDDIKEMLV